MMKSGNQLMKVGKMRNIIDEIRYEGNKIVVEGKTAIAR